MMETHKGDHIYYDNNFMHVQAYLGKRPGEYTMNPYYLKKGFSNKPMFFDVATGKWTYIHPGDRFHLDDEGIARRESVRDL